MASQEPANAHDEQTESASNAVSERESNTQPPNKKRKIEQEPCEFLFAEQVRDELEKVKRKLEVDSNAPSKRRLSAAEREKLKERKELLSTSMDALAVKEPSTTSEYIVLKHRRVVANVPWAQRVKSVIQCNDNTVRPFKFDTKKPFFYGLVGTIEAAGKLDEFRALFQRNSAVESDTLEVQCERADNPDPGANKRPATVGFDGKDDWTDLEKFGRLLQAIFCGEVVLPKQDKVRSHVAKLLIVALAPSKMESVGIHGYSAFESNSEECRSGKVRKEMVDYLWKHVGVLPFDPTESGKGAVVDYQKGVLTDGEGKELPDLKYALVYRSCFDKEFSARVDACSSEEDRRKILLLDDAPKRWLKEMTRQLLKGTEQNGGWESAIPAIVESYQSCMAATNAFQFIKAARLASSPCQDNYPWGNPCLRTKTPSKGEASCVLFNRSLADGQLLSEVCNSLNSTDKVHWFRKRYPNEKLKCAHKLFNDAVQLFVGDAIAIAFGKDAKVTALTRKRVGNAAQTAAPAAAAASGTAEVPASTEALTAVVGDINALLNSLNPYAKLLPVIAKKLGVRIESGELLDADENDDDKGGENDKAKDDDDDDKGGENDKAKDDDDDELEEEEDNESDDESDDESDNESDNESDDDDDEA